jgi:hypothetical protein
MPPWRRVPAVLALLVAGAALLRLFGISQGLGHLPVQSERIFVESAWEMVTHRDLDQRCFLYPGLFFYILYLPIALVHRTGPPSEAAYLVARVVVAAFGIANVPLTYALGFRLSGRRCGLLAAALVALSPLEVATCHWIRPDVVLETFALVAFLVFYSEPKRDLGAGIAIGAATAVKFTGIFLVPSYLARRYAEGTVRLRGLLQAGGMSLVTFCFFTPYALITPERFMGGAQTQLEYQYAAHSESVSHLGAFLFYLRTIQEHLGPVGILLLGLGLLAARKNVGFWAPLLIFPVVAILAHTTATTIGSRFLVPSAPALAIVAALGADSLWDRRSVWGRGLASVALAYALFRSVEFDRKIAEPTPMDQARDWIAAHLPSGSSVLTAEKHLVIDRNRFALHWADGNFWRSDPLTWSDRLMAVDSDLVVADPKDPLVRGFREVYRATPAIPDVNTPLGLFVPPESLKPTYRPVPLEGIHLQASENEELLAALLEHRRRFWHTNSWEGPKSWIQADFGRGVLVGRVTLEPHNTLGSPLRLFVSDDQKTWREAPTVEIDQEIDPPSQTLLCLPVEAHSLRIVPTTKSHGRWAVSGLRLDEVLAFPPLGVE